MALLEQVVITFKADTSDLKRELKTVAKEERDAVKASIELADARNQNLDRYLKQLKAADVAMRVVSTAISAMGSAWEEYEKQATKAGGADAEKARKFRDAMGVVNESIDKIKYQVGRLVASLAPLVELAGKIIGYAADAIGYVGDLAGGVGNAFTSTQSGSGWKGTAMENLGKNTEVRLLNDSDSKRLVDRLNVILGSGLISASAIQTKQYAEGVARNVQLDPFQASSLDVLAALNPLVGGAFRGTGQSQYKGVLKGLKYKKRGGPGAGPTQWETESRDSGRDGGYFNQDLGATGADWGMGAGPVTSTFDSDVAQIIENSKALDIEVARLQRTEKESVIESIFGTPKELDAYTIQLETLGEAVSIFGDALQQGFEAWVSGSASAKEALSGVFKATLSGLASTMFGHAIEEGALAIGALAKGIGGNPLGFGEAAAHGKAAAGYAAAGLAIGAIARQFNMGGATPGAGGAGAAAGGGAAPNIGHVGSGAQPTGGGNVTVVIGDSMADDSPRWRSRQTARAIRRARRELDEGGGGVIYQ